MDREFKNARDDMRILTEKHSRVREEMTKSVMKGKSQKIIKIKWILMSKYNIFVFDFSTLF